MTVYLIARGVYSDYRVLAVCSTLEKAEEYAHLWNSRNPDSAEYDAAYVDDIQVELDPE